MGFPMKLAHNRRLVTAAVLLLIGFPAVVSWTQGGETTAPITLIGAGGTFPAPLYKKWIDVYTESHPNVAITYQAVGSGEGIKRFLAETVDFAASDEFLTQGEASEIEGGAATVPAAAGMIVLAYNIPGVTGGLKLSRDVYADIFAGKISRWNDPRIRAANPEMRFPARDIAVVARLDSSGTTAAFTRHLAVVDPSWRTLGLGIGKLIAWPGKTMLATGNEGVAARIKISEGAIGYVESGFAKRLGLPMAAVQNKFGDFVAPSEAAGQIALSSRVVKVDELEASIVDPPASGAYPIVSYTWLFLYQRYRAPAKGQAIRDFVEWGLAGGQQYDAEFGYIPLSADVIKLGRQVLHTIAR
jgi:phosphate transport system substrate-binding protein